MKSTSSLLLRTVGALAALGFGLVIWQFNRPPFDLAKLQQLRKAMTQQQVRQILGEPQNANTTSWHYSRSMAWPIVHVHFDTNGKLESHEYDR
jgi:hypothetical protein